MKTRSLKYVIFILLLFTAFPGSAVASKQSGFLGLGQPCDSEPLLLDQWQREEAIAAVAPLVERAFSNIENSHLTSRYWGWKDFEDLIERHPVIAFSEVVRTRAASQLEAYFKQIPDEHLDAGFRVLVLLETKLHDPILLAAKRGLLERFKRNPNLIDLWANKHRSKDKSQLEVASRQYEPFAALVLSDLILAKEAVDFFCEEIDKSPFTQKTYPSFSILREISKRIHRVKGLAAEQNKIMQTMLKVLDLSIVPHPEAFFIPLAEFEKLGTSLLHIPEDSSKAADLWEFFFSKLRSQVKNWRSHTAGRILATHLEAVENEANRDEIFLFLMDHFLTGHESDPGSDIVRILLKERLKEKKVDVAFGTTEDLHAIAHHTRSFSYKWWNQVDWVKQTELVEFDAGFAKAMTEARHAHFNVRTALRDRSALKAQLEKARRFSFNSYGRTLIERNIGKRREFGTFPVDLPFATDIELYLILRNPAWRTKTTFYDGTKPLSASEVEHLLLNQMPALP